MYIKWIVIWYPLMFCTESTLSPMFVLVKTPNKSHILQPKYFKIRRGISRGMI